MAIKFGQKYGVTYFNGTSTPNNYLNGWGNLSSSGKYFAIIDTMQPPARLEIYKIDKQSKTMSLIDSKDNSVLSRVAYQNQLAASYSPDEKWLIVWTPTNSTGNQCYIYPVETDGKLGTPQQIQGITGISSNTSYLRASDIAWSNDSKYAIVVNFSSNLYGSGLKVYLIEVNENTGIGTVIHTGSHTPANVGDSGCIWTPDGDKFFVYAHTFKAYFSFDKTTKQVQQITWQDMFDVEPISLNTSLSVHAKSTSQTHMFLGAQLSNSLRVQYSYDAKQGKYIKNPDTLSQLSHNTYGISYSTDDRYMFVRGEFASGTVSVLSYNAQTHTWNINSDSAQLPNFEGGNINTNNYNNYNIRNVQATNDVLLYKINGQQLPHTIQLWDIKGITPNKMRIADEVGNIYHPETNADIVLIEGKTLTSVISDIQNNIQSVEADVTTLEGKLQGDEYGIIHKTKPATLRNGDFYIG